MNTYQLQHTATHCNALQHTDQQYSGALTLIASFRAVAVNSYQLQHTATHCNTLQHADHQYSGALNFIASLRAVAVNIHRFSPAAHTRIHSCECMLLSQFLSLYTCTHIRVYTYMKHHCMHILIYISNQYIYIYVCICVEMYRYIYK